MAFEMAKMEAPRPVDRSLGAEQLKEALMDVAHNLRSSGIPVKDDCRIDMEAFADSVYPREKIKIHLSNLEGREKTWAGRSVDPRKVNWRTSGAPEKSELKTLEQSGDKLEALLTIVLYHMLNEHFYIIRTSRHDDTKNGIDTLIIDKTTGNVVGAFDEVVDNSSGDRFHEKVEKILRKNFEGGGKIHYGIAVKDKRPIPVGLQENIPVFHLALTEEELDRGLAQLNEGMSPEYEKWLLSRFLISTGAQISYLREREKDLNPTLRERLSLFEEKLKEVEGDL